MSSSKRISMNVQITEMSPIDEEASNLFDFSDLSKSINLQQSQNKNTPTPTNIIKQAEEIKKTDEDEENEIKKDAVEIHKIKAEQSSYTGSGHGRQTMAAGSTGTILWGRNIQQEAVMEATPNYQQIINSHLQLRASASHLESPNMSNKTPQIPYKLCFDTPGASPSTNSDDVQLYYEARYKQLEEQFQESERQKDQLRQQKDEIEHEKNQIMMELRHKERKLAMAENSIEEFEELEGKMIFENFQLKKQLLQLKLDCNLITIEEACKDLGCRVNEFM